MALHRLSAGATVGVQWWNVDDLGSTFGAMRSKAIDALDRLATFGCAEVHAGQLQVAAWVPPLAQSFRSRLPDYLIGFYDERLRAA